MTTVHASNLLCHGNSDKDSSFWVCYKCTTSFDKRSSWNLWSQWWYTEIFLKEKSSKQERHATETLVNNSFIKERVTFPFEWTICVEQSQRYNFFDDTLSEYFGQQKFCKQLPDMCQYTEIFLEEKFIKRERRAIETLINYSFIKEKVFKTTVCLKSMCQIEREISVFD